VEMWILNFWLESQLAERSNVYLKYRGSTQIIIIVATSHDSTTSLFKIDKHSFLKSKIDLGTQYKQKIYGEINQEQNQTTNVTDAISVQDSRTIQL
jgi:hypothetical protein